MHRTLKEQLKRGLNTLPAPKNDYEIVVPEEEMDEASGAVPDGEVPGTFLSVEDQADVDARIEAEWQKQSIEFCCSVVFSVLKIFNPFIFRRGRA